MAQSMTEAGQEFIAHFGVKGMHWGVHRDSTSGGSAKRAELIAKAKNHENISRAHTAAAAHTQKEAVDLATRGQHSDAFKRVYGKDAPNQGDLQFQFRNGTSKAVALAQTENNIRILHNQYVHSANRHAKKASKLRDKAAKIQIKPVAHSSTEDDISLQHFGVKGMHWGVHTSIPGSADHERAQQVGHLIKTSGVRSASNKDLQDLVNRLNLEQQHARLTAHPSRVEAGHKFVRTTLGLTKTGLDVVQTGQRVVNVVDDARETASRHQRNKPLKVFRIGQ
jgi:hypothetical protein